MAIYEDSHMTISIEAEKTSDKIQSTFVITVMENVGPDGTYFNMIKALYGKCIVIIILNREKLEVYPLKLGVKQECPLFPLFFNIILKH